MAPVFLLALAACAGTACPEGQVRRDGRCEDYAPGDPVEPADEVWRPAPGTTWQWQLTGEVDTGPEVAMFDIDLFDVPDEVIATLHDAGRTVICYFSAGTWEEWRDDAGDFPADALGAELDGWPGERWLDVTDATVREIMRERLDHAVDRGCDGVEPDNVDGWANDNGVGLNATEQLDYNRFIADEAHARGLSVGLKNDLDQLEELVDWFDWALDESCAEYDECDRLAVFTEQAGLAAFHAEYVDDWADAPALAEAVCGVGPELSTIIKTWDLGPERLACD